MSNIKELREDEDIVYTDTDLEHGPVHDTKEVENTIVQNVNTVIAENRQDKKVNDEKFIIMLQLRNKHNRKTVLLLTQNMAVLMNLRREILHNLQYKLLIQKKKCILTT